MSYTPVPPLLPGDLEVSAFQVTRPKVINDAVTQLVDEFTPVTLNASAGIVTLYPSILSPYGGYGISVFNTYVGAGAIVLTSIQDYSGTTGLPNVIVVGVSDGMFSIVLLNGGTSALNGIVKVGFLIV